MRRTAFEKDLKGALYIPEHVSIPAYMRCNNALYAT